METYLEVLGLLFAAAAAGYAGKDVLVGWTRQRRESAHVDYLSSTDTAATSPPPPRLLERRLRSAGLPGPAEAYLFGISLAVATAGYWVLQLLPDVPFAAIVGGAFAVYIPWAAVNEVARRRANKIEHQLTDAIDLAAGTMQAGSSLTQALATAASVSRQPLHGELNEVLHRLSLSMPFERAFARLNERYDSEGVRLFTVAVAAKSQAGGELTPLLRALNETLRDRWRQQRQVRAQLAGARITAVVVVLLPYLVAPVLAYLEPGWFDAIAKLPLGPAILFFAVVLQLIGALWIWRILAREL